MSNSGGVIHTRAVMVTGLEALLTARKKLTKRASLVDGLFSALGLSAKSLIANEAMTPQWFKEHQIKAHLDTGLFPDNCALQPLPLSFWQEIMYCVVSLVYFGMFLWLPLTVLLLIFVVPLYSLHVIAAVGVVILVGYVMPCDFWPPFGRDNWTFEILYRFLPFQFISLY